MPASVTESASSGKLVLIPGTHAEFIQEGELLTLGAEGVDRLLGVFGVLRFAAVMNHFSANVAIDELLDLKESGPAPMRLAEQHLLGGEISLRLVRDES